MVHPRVRTRPLAAVGVALAALHGPSVLAAQRPTTSTGAALVGTVTLDETGQPVDRARLSVVGGSARTETDGSGRYRLALPPGPQVIVVRALGTLPDTLRLTLVAGRTERRDVVLRRQAAVLAQTIVTAQKRTESTTEVPIAVTAYEGDFLRRVNVQQFDELAYHVPNLNMQLQSPNNPSFSIRGITSDDGSAQIEPRVSVFVDGVPSSRSRGSVMELFDLERVEVLKGPQGTLFSRGAQIGAIHLVQAKPVAQRQGEVRIGTGNFDERFAQAMLNTPLVADRLLFRIAAIHNTREGFIPNLSGGALQGKHTTAVRGSLRWLPSPRTVVDVIGNYQNDQPPGTAFTSGAFAPRGFPASPFGTNDFDQGTALGVERHLSNVSLLVSQRLGERWQLRSISGFRRFWSDEAFDADGTVSPALRLREIAQGNQWSSELRAEYEGGGRFRGFVGASGFHEDGSQRVPFTPDERALWALTAPIVLNAIPANVRPIFAPRFPAPFVVNGVATLPTNLPNIPEIPQLGLRGQPLNVNANEQTENFGRLTAAEVFADGTFDATSQLSLTAGVRGTREWVDNALFVAQSAVPGTLGPFLGGGTNNLFRPSGGRLSATGTFDSWVGRAIAQWRPDARVNLYASVSKGRRPNIVQFVAAPAPGTGYVENRLDDEDVLSYEVGFKGRALGDRLSIEAAAFRYDYDNFQTQVNVPGPTPGQLLNVTRDDGRARAAGVELAVRAQATRELELFGTWGQLDAAFLSTDANGQPQRFAANRFRLAPRFTYSAGLTWQRLFPNRAGLAVTPTWTWRGQHFFEEANQPGIEQGAYGLLNFRASFTLPGGRFDVTGIVRNALNERFLIDAGNTGGLFGIPTFIPGAPRFVSVQLGWRY